MPATLPDVWREVSRHTDIAEAVERIVHGLRDAMPLTDLVVRRADWTRSRLETVAHGVVGGAGSGAHVRTELSPAQVERVLVWGRAGGVAIGPPGERHPVLDAVVPGGTTGDVIAGPLRESGDLVGIVLVVGPPHALGPAHAQLVQQLLEPITVALMNDARLHELQRLREAVEAENRTLLAKLGRQEITEAVVGADAGLREVMARVAQVAATDVPVLLLGETGTGKEVVARELHRLSSRAAGPVVRINCGAIPPGLIDSELFGHERGSFSGAVKDREGWFERADGGTLFLDEIGELPPDAQVRLLRVLQDGTFERVGGHRTHHVDVRVVAATHRDLWAMLADGRFREDLWYRIAVFPVRLPPLRERPEDIPALAAHFAWRAGQRLGGAPLAPSPADMDLLVKYPWPGNVRELAAVIERAVILGGGRAMEIEAALGGLRGSSPAPAAPRAEARASAPVVSLDEAMAEHIQRALHATGGRIEGPGGAAALLRINPHTLRARMKKLGVDWSRFRAAASA